MRCSWSVSTHRQVIRRSLDDTSLRSRRVLDFTNHIRRIPIQRWFFFEVIPGNRPQKLYFDIDIKIKEVSPPNQEGLNRTMNCLLAALVGRIQDRFWQRGVQLDLERNILLFSSHSDVKRSLHLIVDGYVFANHLEIQALVREILDGFPPEYLAKKFVDPGVYSSLQQLRLYGSQKPESGRPKIFVDEWIYGAQVIRSKFVDEFLEGVPDATTRDSLKFNLLFTASCVTAVSNCKPLQITEIPDVKYRLRSSDPKDDVEVTEEMVEAIRERMSPTLLQIYKISTVHSPFIELRRGPGGEEQLFTL